MTIKDGSVSREQIERIREAFTDVSGNKTRILVTHHPLFAMPLEEEEGALTKVANRSTDALAAAADAGVDILLAGHFHRAFSISAREMVDTVGPALVIQAGTATSTRLRGGEQQSFNWMEVVKDRVELQVQRWEERCFVSGRPTFFEFADGNWRFAGRREEEGVPAVPFAERARQES